ncbi:acyl-CoA dehydrogenase family protein [Novosphingobium sp. Chol11]|uniref:acyl-CoA dehydrogenase family protein n=1 Tax=Novosphingobium sp. Chol11 TaxID=1385763 RepID=UPI000BE26B7D|nr:acyl-CoA dehydrogenase family protein [Novosphingobium sp. Chol11]
MEFVLKRPAQDDETLDLFRDTVRRVVDEQLVARRENIERDGIVHRNFWTVAGAAGMLCPGVPEQWGGMGLDFRFNAVVLEERAYAGSCLGTAIHSDIVADYLVHYGSDTQKARYLPKMVSGEWIGAIAMTEPNTGSDLKAIRTSAVRDGDAYILNGSKTYITNGMSADFVIVVAKTNPALGSKGISLLLVDCDLPGFERGRHLDKIGQHSSDTAELFFRDVRVPADHVLGEEGFGFRYLMAQLPQERLSVAIEAQAAAQRAFDEACAFTKDRQAFGKPIFDFQNSRFQLASMATQLQVGWAHIDWAIARHVAGQLTGEEAAAAKLWHTEMQGQVTDAALQLFGGAGYMNEYLIAQLYRDARVSRIYAGTSEIMREVIGRAL